MDQLQMENLMKKAKDKLKLIPYRTLKFYKVFLFIQIFMGIKII